LQVVSAKSIKCRSRPSHSLWSAIKQDFHDNAWLQLGPHPFSCEAATHVYSFIVVTIWYNCMPRRRPLVMMTPFRQHIVHRKEMLAALLLRRLQSSHLSLCCLLSMWCVH
jgi:hypothetical protein